MTRRSLQLKPGTLWPSIVRQTRNAIRCGALHVVKTEHAFVEQYGVRFLVRIVSSLMRKDAAKQEQAERTQQSDKGANPFLPYERDLYVAGISDTHLAVLNKFNVIDHHLLIVTRDFEDQETLLTLNDFEALWVCMAEYAGLGFYNGGTTAGASQRHKHLQLVPLPLADEGPAIPMEPLIASTSFEEPIGMIPGFPFLHAFTWLTPSLVDRPFTAAEATLSRYHAMLDAVGLNANNVGGKYRQSAPYNLLVTRRWMLLVPRSVEFFDSISVNALGFAGALLVRNEHEMATIKQQGPMTALEHVALPVA